VINRWIGDSLIPYLEGVFLFDPCDPYTHLWMACYDVIGVGKGRQMAGLIKENYLRGRTKAI